MNSDLPPAQGSPPKRAAPPQAWVSSTYFAEGFPYSLINNVMEIMFQQMGASLRVIGLTSLFHLPWNLKFLWGPFVDQYETKRSWLIWTEVALSLGILFIASVVGAQVHVLLLVSVAALLLAFLSATHDIAIDGFYLEALNSKEQAIFVGWRATFYRIAGISLSGPLLWIIGKTSWTVGLFVVVAMMAGLTLFHSLWLPRVEKRKRPWGELFRLLARPRLLFASGLIAAAYVSFKQSFTLQEGWALISERARSLPLVGSLSVSDWLVLALLVGLLAALFCRKKSARVEKKSEYLAAFTSFMDQRRALLILSFVILFRAGESFLTKMRWPFLSEVVEMSLDNYAITNGVLGIVASFSATILGGWWIARVGLRRCIWPFVLAQNVLNLLYVWLAAQANPEAVSPLMLGAIIAIEHAGAGLGTAVFMVYLMRCCDPEHKAAHMAILTALMSVSFTVAGTVSGYLAEAMGFAFYFGLTFVATIPAMLLIPWLPYLDHGRSAQAPG